MGYVGLERRWVFPLAVSSLLCIFLLATSFNMGLINSAHTINAIFSIFPSRLNQTHPTYAEMKVRMNPSSPAGPTIPRFAYLISGSKGDLDKLWRTLYALYHPRNHYIVHLDLESSQEERLELSRRVENDPMFSKIGNVFMNTKANMVTYRGPTMVSNTLHACAILLKQNREWDWFINLSASDYPLVTQDDLLFTFSHLDRKLNFIEHTSKLGWKFEKRAMPLMVDPGLYMTTKSDIFWVSQKRQLPTAFNLFTGSAWMVLSRSFVEYVIWGWDNLPRTLLMYHANFISSPESYFQTVICNVPEFVPTVVNHDLHFISWDDPPGQHPHVLSVNDTNKMIASNAAFARKFQHNTRILNRIDKKLLGRKKGNFTPGAWCSGDSTCSKVGDINKIKPGPGAERLRTLMSDIVVAARRGENQCIYTNSSDP